MLALVRGEPPSRIRRETGAAYATIRSARVRYREGGVEALAAHRPPKGKKARDKAGERALRLRPALPAILLEQAALERRRGRVPAARLAIETWGRDAVALGAVAPGSAFPTMRRAGEAFRATLPVVRAAFATLERQGFSKGVGRERTVAANPPPFAGRYLFVNWETPDNDRVGYMESVRAVAARIAAERGAVFEFAGGDGAFERRSPRRTALFAAMREQRWAGVYFREWTQRMELAGEVRIDNVPVCIPYLAGMRPRSFKGSHVVKPVTPSPDFLLEQLVEDCARAGCRRLAVVDRQYNRRDDNREEFVRCLAARHGLQVGPWHYQELLLAGETPGDRATIRAALKALLAPGREWNPDCIVLMDDHWLAPLEEALDATRRATVRQAAGSSVRRLYVACLGNRPTLPATRLPVSFRGYDIGATLDSFVAWCEAIHAGAKDPPRPVLATF